MTDIRAMTTAQLLARAEIPVDTDRDLTALLQRAAKIADEENDHALSLLFSVLSEEPPEVAAGWAPALEEMSAKLHPDTDHPTLARAVAKALAQWRDAEELRPPPLGLRAVNLED